MQRRICFLLAFAGLITSECNAATEKEHQIIKDRPTVPAAATSYNAYTDDDLYLSDQEDFEGSGRGGGEVRDDLEASGSGLGPDDEDGDGDTDFNKRNKIEPVPSKPADPKATYQETAIRTLQPNVETINRPDNGIETHESVRENDREEDTDSIRGVPMNPKHEEHASSFFAQPGVLAAVIGGAVVGLLCAILVVMFVVYRLRKKDEGSYALDEPRRSPVAQAYPKPGAPHHNREFYA